METECSKEAVIVSITHGEMTQCDTWETSEGENNSQRQNFETRLLNTDLEFQPFLRQAGGLPVRAQAGL